MAENQEQHTKGKRKKWPWITLAIILLLAGFVRYTLQADWFFNQIKQFVEQTANDQIRGDLQIDRMKGDLFSHIDISGITLADTTGGEITTIDSIGIRYRLIELIRSPRILESIDIYRLRADLIEDETGWNILNLLPDTEPDPDEEPIQIPELEIRDIALHDHEISVSSPALPDEYALIESLDLHAGLRLAPDYQQIRLENLDFVLTEGRLDGPLEFATSARMDDGRVNLQSLTLAGAHTFLESSGEIDLEEGSFSFEALLDPLGYEDIIPYVDDFPVVQNLVVNLSSSGNFSNFTAGISISADGLEYLNLNAGFETGSPLQLTSFQVETGRIDPLVLLNEQLPTLNSLNLDLTGAVSFENWENGSLSGELSITDIIYDSYRLDHYKADLNWNGEEADINQLLSLDDEQIAIDVSLSELFDERFWEASLDFRSINPGLWLADETLEGRVNGTVDADGKDFDLSEDPVTYFIELDNMELMGERIDALSVNGFIDEEFLEADSRIQIREGVLTTRLESGWQDSPINYDVRTEASNLDLSAISMLEELPSDLNFIFEGQGSGTSLEELSLTGNFNMDRSEVDGRVLESLTTSFSVNDTILTVEDTYISSSIADGNITARYHLQDYTDLNNRLDFNLDIKDIQPFAEMVGADTLSATGYIAGQIEPDENQELLFDSNLNLSNVAFDTLYVHEINARAQSALTSTPHYNANLEILNPRLGDFKAQDLNISTSGSVAEDLIAGDYRFEFNISDESGLAQEAAYDVANGDIKLTTTLLSIFDPSIEYNLQESFGLTIDEQGTRLDTLTLASEDESTFSMAFDQDTTGAINGYFSGERANLGAIQRAFLDEPVFQGLLSGETDFMVADEQLEANSDIRLTGFSYNKLTLDLMSFNLNIADQRLMTEFFVEDEGDRLVDSRFDLPFEPIAPEELDEKFFEEAVDGYLTIDPVDISRFQDFMEKVGIGQQEGILALDTDLSGKAGSPNLFGDMILYDGTLSGVAVDSIRFSWDYEHSSEQLSVRSNVESLGQRIADLEGTVPFSADFQTFEVDVPGDDDEIDFRLNTTDFRMAAFNDFLPAGYVRELEGLLNANIDITGTLGEPDLNGNINYTGGSVFLVENNVRISNIQLFLGIEPEQLTLKTFQARSNGLISGSGSIGLEGFMPESFNLRINGRNFRAYNTRDIEAMVSLNTRLTGDLQQPSVSGNFRIERGTLYLDNFGERTVEDVQLDDDEILLDAAEEIDFFNRLAIEMSVSMDRNVFLRNRRDPEMNLALRGDLELVKAHRDDLEVFGDLNIPSGHITTILNKRFDLESGVILFSGDPLNPELDIRALHRPPQQAEEIRIWYVISGDVEEPEFAYESEPEMELQDIISYTLFGRPFESLAGWERTVSGRGEANMASDLALDILLDRVEALAGARLGIDVIEIDNTRRSTGGGTSIKAGKFLTDRLFVAYLQELGGTRAGRQVIVEYLIRSNLELHLTASDDYRSGVDLMWRYDY